MVRFINEQMAPIRILHKEINVIIEEKDSYDLPITEGIVKIQHMPINRDGNSSVDSFFYSTLQKTVLIVDCSFHVVSLGDNCSITISNKIHEHTTGDFGYQYFNVKTENCECYLQDCESINTKEVLRMQKVIRIGEAFDIPPFTTIASLHRYNTIKKMCHPDRVLDFLIKETKK